MPKPTYTPAVNCAGKPRPAVLLRFIKSNKLVAEGYSPGLQVFAAQFSKDGAVYHYPNFTQQQYDDFQAAESRGRHMGQHIQILPSEKYDAEISPAEPAPETSDATQAAA